MKNMPLPSRDSARADLLTSIRRYRYKRQYHGHAITEDEINEILLIYDQYDSDKGIACDMLFGEALPGTLINALYDAYDKTQENRQLYTLRQTLFEGVTLCPICGIDPAVELDHFLPRSQFKPLSIYARNLVPICHACNHAKLAGFGVEDESKCFLHSYFDTLPDVQFLNAVIDIREAALLVAFEIMIGIGLSKEHEDRLVYQMASLKLNERYESEINTYISSHAVSLHMQYISNGKSGVRNFLNLQSRFEAKNFYRNHWRPTLLAALSRHDDFIDGGFAKVLPLPEDVLNDVANM